MIDDDYEWNRGIIDDQAVVILENCPMLESIGNFDGYWGKQVRTLPKKQKRALKSHEHSTFFTTLV